MLARFQPCIEELGITAKVRPSTPALPGIQQAEAHLVRGASAEDYSLRYGSVVRFTDVAAAGGAHRPALVFTTFVAPKTAETFRRAGVQYLDTAGNAWIVFGDVLVDIRGRPRPDRAASRPRAAAGNLFSTGRAQVCLRCSPGRSCGTRRSESWPTQPASLSGRPTTRWRCWLRRDLDAMICGLSAPTCSICGLPRFQLVSRSGSRWRGTGGPSTL